MVAPGAPIRLSPAPADSPRITRALELLQEVKDPEIPTISVLELGLIRSVSEFPDGLEVEMMPTFLGCPALDALRTQIREDLGILGRILVRVVTEEPWTTSRISEEGRRKLAQAGLAPPPVGELELNVLQPRVSCPYCHSEDTRMENPFGPTLCRAIHYCNACRQPFEGFKAI